MFRYIATRIGQGVFVLWAAYTVTFLILFLLPGDAAQVMAGGLDSETSAEQIEALRHEFGLDRPLYVQYVVALGKAVTLDFGDSFRDGRPAVELVGSVLPETLRLAALALPIAIVFGVALALGSVFSRRRWVRRFISSLPALGVAVPTFWVGLMLLQLFSFRLRAFPALGNEGFASLVLPAVTLAIPTGAIIAQLLSKSLRQTLGEPYIQIVRSKGAGRWRVNFGHALRNATLPTLTMLGILVGNLLAGATVSETVFSRVGIGRLTVTAVNDRDIPLVQVLVLFVAAVFVVVNLVVDLLYPLVDPRIRVSAGREPK
ncbi:ABC transporter permease [Brooklawnia cerclae]|uniref:Peptide/nickel transport system permease protein n=1 Tax=Brooklawnia cerclae TaxID=349934 RepID=A0ABX0SHK1_9ACTN|nr:ABC transporter permease [Brooklawnia cerclae]NIH57834.1 peptide/nickel transport system permease protein [Brooklawnia cerclae]